MISTCKSLLRGVTIYVSYDSLGQEHGGVEADGRGTRERGRGRCSGAPSRGTTVVTHIPHTLHTSSTTDRGVSTEDAMKQTHKPLLELHFSFYPVSFSWIVFVYVWLLKVSLCGLGDPNLPCLCGTPKTAKNHKQRCRCAQTLGQQAHTSFSYLLHTVPTAACSLTARNKCCERRRQFFKICASHKAEGGIYCPHHPDTQHRHTHENPVLLRYQNKGNNREKVGSSTIMREVYTQKKSMGCDREGEGERTGADEPDRKEKGDGALANERVNNLNNK